MKKRQIFLGIAALMIAAGAAFASAVEKTNTLYWYGTPGNCQSVNESFECSPDPSATCRKSSAPSINAVLHENEGCESPLRLEAGF